MDEIAIGESIFFNLTNNQMRWYLVETREYSLIATYGHHSKHSLHNLTSVLNVIRLGNRYTKTNYIKLLNSLVKLQILIKNCKQFI